MTDTREPSPVAWRYWRNAQSGRPRPSYARLKPNCPNSYGAVPLYSRPTNMDNELERARCETEALREALDAAKSDIQEFRAKVCAIIEARDDEDFEALIAAIDKAQRLAFLSAMTEADAPLTEGKRHD